MTVAPFSKKAIAWLVDMHISMIFLVIAYVVSSKAFAAYDGWLPWAITIVAFTAWWMVGFVNRCIIMGRGGQSWGRKLFDISLVHEHTGRPIGIWKAFIRENTHFVDYGTLGYGWFRPLKDPKGGTFADLFNKTITIYGPPPGVPVVLAGQAPTTHIDEAPVPNRVVEPAA